MVHAEILYLIGFVSQATFALTMALLAWSDRRTRAMDWLAAGCILQLLATSVRFVLPTRMDRTATAAGSCLLILVFACVYMGLRWFVVRKPLYSQWGTSVVTASVALAAGFAIMKPSFALLFARLVVLSFMAVTARMLWNTHFNALRISARFCACQLGLVATVFLFRMATDTWTHDHLRTSLTMFGRGGILISVSLLSFSFIALFVAESKRRLHEETRTDALTGLCNRRAMEEFAADEVRLAELNDTPLALLMLDLDKFKSLNDTWGHWTGDRALRALGETMRQTVGMNDITARVGGEEFAVLLPGRDLSGAEMLAEQLRRAVEKIRLEEASETITMTVSIGVSTRRSGERSWADMLRRADKALYQAKRDGRNRVVVFDKRTLATEGLHASRRAAAKALLTGTGTKGWTRERLKSN